MCVVKVVRHQFPSETGLYMGFHHDYRVPPLHFRVPAVSVEGDEVNGVYWSKKSGKWELEYDENANKEVDYEVASEE